MNVLYLIAMYGSQYLGNLIHRELGQEFIKSGHHFSVFALTSMSESQSQDPTEPIPVYRAVAAGRPAEDIINRLTKPILIYDRFAVGTWHQSRYLKRHPEVDLILAEGAYPFGAMAALAARRHLIITVAGGDFIASGETNYGYGRFRTARFLTRLALQHSSGVRVTTPLVREAILALGASPSQISLIPRNIASYCYAPADQPLDAFRAAARSRICARHELGHAQVIAAVGRLLPIKGFDLLIRALPCVQEIAGDTRVLLIGPNRIDSRFGNYQEYLRRLATDLGVGNQLVLAGAVPHPEIREYLAAADVIAVPSVLEGMNKVVVEGAAVGTPSVVTATAGIADLMRNANIGTIVQDRSAEVFGNALGSLLRDPVQRMEMGQRGVEFAAQFSSARVGAELIAFCERVLSDLAQVRNRV